MFHVILSKTSVSLWDNAIPSVVYECIAEKANISYKPYVKNLQRDNIHVVQVFQQLYGKDLEGCKYAKITSVPIILRNFYDIIQPICYGTIKTEEFVQINVEDFVSYYENTNYENEVKEIVKYKIYKSPYSIYKYNLII